MSPAPIAAALLTLLALSGCGADYHPGVSGMKRILPQNAASNAGIQPAGSLPR